MPTDTNDTETEITPIRIEMNDESVYVLDTEERLRAFHLKYGDEDPDEVLDAFRERVAEHWANRTKPWKGITVEWGCDPWMPEDVNESFDDHADLAAEVMYSALRAPLMAMAMQDRPDEEEGPEDGPSVIGISDDGVVEYTGDERVEHGTTDEVLPHTDEHATE